MHVPVSAEDPGAAEAAGAVLLIVVSRIGAAPPEVAYQSFTPPCPLQAPLLEEALVEVPSLHVPVAADAEPAAVESAVGAESVFLWLLLDTPAVSGLPAGEIAEDEGSSDLLLVLAFLVDAGFSELAAGELATALTPYHFLIPSCPLHAPLFEAAEV